MWFFGHTCSRDRFFPVFFLSKITYFPIHASLPDAEEFPPLLLPASLAILDRVRISWGGSPLPGANSTKKRYLSALLLCSTHTGFLDGYSASWFFFVVEFGGF